MSTDHFTVVDHPLVSAKLTVLRDKTTPPYLFRQLVHELTWLVAYEAARDLPVEPHAIETPLAAIEGTRIAGGPPAIVSVLRAGLAMAEALQQLLPDAVQGHIGLYRDHDTHRPVEYYDKLPPMGGRPVFVVDPMLATGYSAAAALTKLKDRGAAAADLHLLVLVAAPEGVAVLADAHPDVRVTAAVLDSHLDDNAYIVPGLGDAGDRIFGTM